MSRFVDLVGDTCSGEADWPERAALADRRAAMFERWQA